MLPPDQKQHIHDLFYSDPIYVQHEKEHLKDFIVKLQVAKYDSKIKEDPTLVQAGIESIRIGLTESRQSVFIFQGKLQNEATIRDVCYYMLSILQNQKNQEYYIIYLNTDLFTHSHLSKFYKVFLEFPVQYFQNLQRILIIHGNVFIKSWFWFQSSVQIKVLKEKTVYLDKIKNLLNYEFFQEHQFEKLPLYCRDSSYGELQQQFKQQQPLLYQKKIQQIYGLELDQYELTKKRIPLILDLTISKLLSNPKNIQIEGIFRLSSSKSQEELFENYVKESQFQEILDYDNVIVVANFIKRVLDKLTFSVVPYYFYDKLCQPQQYSLEFVEQLLKQFPPLNQNLFALIILMLQKVAEHQTLNKMGSSNLAILFGISLCRPKEYSQDDVAKQYQQVKQVNKFIEFIIENSAIIYKNQSPNDYLIQPD